MNRLSPPGRRPFRKAMVFISWAPFCSRSDSIASHLGGQSFMVYAVRYGSHYVTVPFKYLSQTIKTLRILFRERPAAVFVMTPPVTACLPVWIYSRATGAPFVIDAHTGAFLDPRWKPLLFVHKWFSRAARTTMVTNEYMYEILRKWRASATIVRDVPVRFAEPERPKFNGACNMTLVCTFTPDEPVELFMKAATRLPDVQFHVTGNYQRADARTIATKPANVTLTGFLTDSEYVGLLLASDAVICLTTRDHTMQRGAYEAMYLGRPVITSNFDLLRRHFYKGCVHVDITVDDVVAGVSHMRSSLERFRTEIGELREERLQEWGRVEADLKQMIAGRSWSFSS
jgi:glycosyltransferase involved in cell wall biosynthesis